MSLFGSSATKLDPFIGKFIFIVYQFNFEQAYLYLPVMVTGEKPPDEKLG